MKTGIRLDAGFFVIRICQLFILKLKLYDEKMDSDPNKRLFPIPQSTVDAASGINGFLEQNQGY